MVQLELELLGWDHFIKVNITLWTFVCFENHYLCHKSYDIDFCKWHPPFSLLLSYLLPSLKITETFDKRNQ